MAGPHRRLGGTHAGDHTPGDGGGRVPFWMHQVVELLLGMLLLVEGARTGEHTAVLVTLGSLLLLLALCSDRASSVAWSARPTGRPRRPWPPTLHPRRPQRPLVSPRSRATRTRSPEDLLSARSVLKGVVGLVGLVWNGVPRVRKLGGDEAG